MKMKKTRHFCNFEERNFVQKATCFIQKENDEIFMTAAL